jgi:hypothetical protein
MAGAPGCSATAGLVAEGNAASTKGGAHSVAIAVA